ncbi:MAG TPA: cyclic nucleotide-binding domain-containing protein [Gaiellaceae bacterium]|nr:cyclic nucleotide-binding domain-containing protein [Gaiellaceae bacterium]
MATYLRRIPAVLGSVFGNPELRRVELAFAGFNAAEWAVWIAMIVYAYDRGGATTAGLVALAQLLPAALFAPVAATLGDRSPPGRVLLWGYVAQAAGMGLTATVLLADGPAALAYASAALAATAVTITRPAQAALVPALARRPEELTAANVVAGWIEGLSVLVAPAVAGLLLGVSGPGWVFAVMAAVAVASAVLVAPVPGPPPAGGQEARSAVLAETAESIRLVRREPAVRLLVVLLGLQFVAIGALDVLFAELAIGVLDRDDAWAGYLNAAFGLGGTLGIAATVALVGRRRLVPALLAALAAWAAAFLVLGLEPTLATALVLLTLGGAARSVYDVAGRTLLQRVAPTALLARVFGLLEGLTMAGLALGSLLAPALVALGGAELALLGVAALLPLAALVGGRRLLRIDRAADVPVVEIGLLRSLPLFAPLGAATLESLARALEPVDAAAGSVVIREGDPGDRFFVVADGEIDVSRSDGVTAVLRRGDGFGEIALLRDVPRTATCTARTDVVLQALAKDDFLVAVTGHVGAAAEADRLVDARLAPDPAGP